jgi:cysteine desulfurase
MMPVFHEAFGNPSSREHAYGWQAEAMVAQARDRVAALLGCSPREIVFTSGATESNNLAIKGVAAAYAARRRRHVIVSAIEHASVLQAVARLEGEGIEVTRLPVSPLGLIDPEELAAAIRPETILASVMFANNEIGTIQPVARVGEICKEHGVFFHCDAVQAAAHEKIDVQAIGADLLSISGHKMHGPQGVGALYVRRRNPRARLVAQMDGGGQEWGMRSGTLNVAGIVGLGEAARIVAEERQADAARLRQLRRRLEKRLREALPWARVIGAADKRLPGSLHMIFPGLEGEGLVGGVRLVAVSSGAACASVSTQPSHVLEAIGLSPELGATALRFGLHRFTTKEQVDAAADEVIALARERRHRRAEARLEDKVVGLGA